MADVPARSIADTASSIGLSIPRLKRLAQLVTEEGAAQTLYSPWKCADNWAQLLRPEGRN